MSESEKTEERKENHGGTDIPENPVITKAKKDLENIRARGARGAKDRLQGKIEEARKLILAVRGELGERFGFVFIALNHVNMIQQYSLHPGEDHFPVLELMIDHVLLALRCKSEGELEKELRL